MAVQRLLIVLTFLFGGINSLYGQQLIVQASHTGSIEALCFSPDGTLILSGSDDCARLWETRSGRLLRNFKGHNGSIAAAAFSPDSKYIVTGGTDSLAIIWNTETGARMHTISGFKFWPNNIVFNPVNNTVAISDGYLFFVTDLQSGKVVLRYRFFFFVNNISYNKTGNLLAITGSFFDSTPQLQQATHILNTSNWRIQSSSPYGDTLKITACYFTNDTEGLTAWMEDRDGKISLYAIKDIKNWEIIGKSKVHYDELTDYKLSGNGKYMARWDKNGFTVHATVVNDGQLTHYAKISKPVTALAFSGNSEKIVTIDDEGTIFYREAESGKLLNTIPTNMGDNARQITIDHLGRYFALGDFNGRVFLAGTQTGRVVHRLEGKNATTHRAILSKDGNRLYTTNSDYFLRSWDITAARQIGITVDIESRANALVLSPDGQEIAYVDNAGYLGIYSIITGEVYNFKCEDYCSRYISAAYHPTRHIVAAAFCNAVEVFDLDSGKLAFKITSPYQDDQLAKIAYSADGTQLYGLNILGDLFVWDAYTGKRIRTIPYYYYRPKTFEVPENGQKITMVCKDTAVRIIETKNYTELQVIKGFTPYLRNARLSPDDNQLLVDDGDSVFLLDANTQRKLYSLYTGGYVVTIHWQNDKMVVERDGQLLFYSISKGTELFSIIAFEDDDYLFLLPDRNYTITKSAASQVGWIEGLKRYDFDQFDLINNRPDKVLRALGNTDTALIEVYEKAWRKRVKRAGINPETLSNQLHTPEITVQGIDALPLETNKPEIEITLTANDNLYPLTRFNVWVNGVPLYTAAGKTINNKNKYSAQLKIPLSEGRNQIQFSATNAQGIESFRPSVDIIYTPEVKQQARTWFIGFGVNDYKDNRYTLNYSVKDIQNLTEYFSRNPNSTIDTFTDMRVTRENILAVKQKLMNTRIEDKVIIAFSGHGLLDDSLNFYYATQDIDFKQPAKRGVLYEEIKSLLDGIPARKKLLLMDACHSGESDKEEGKPDLHVETGHQDTGALLITRFGSRGLELLDDVTQSGVGLQNSFELMQELFADLSRGSGAWIISAAAGNSYAYEKNDLKNGVFTWCILNGLQNMAADIDEDETITVSELEQYVKKKVSELTNGAQKPTSRSGLINFDWEF